MMLSEKQKQFCKEYTVDFNGSAAANRAGYSKSRARKTASELLSNEEIIKEISVLISKREKNDDRVQRVINELEAIAYAKTTDYVKVKDMIVGKGKTRRKIRVAYIELTSEVEAEKQKAISEIRQTKDGISLKTHDKVKALELLGRHHGIFEKDNQQTQPKIVFSKKVTFK